MSFSDINEVTIMGRVGKDPVLRTTQTGKEVVSFSVATSESYNEVETTTWHNIKAWGKTASACGKYLHKGSRVYVSGKIALNKYTAQDGTERQQSEVVANRVIFLDPKSKSGFGESSGSVPKEQPPSASFEDDIPF